VPIFGIRPLQGGEGPPTQPCEPDRLYQPTTPQESEILAKVSFVLETLLEHVLLLRVIRNPKSSSFLNALRIISLLATFVVAQLH
jgi:hypothetical protein